MTTVDRSESHQLLIRNTYPFQAYYLLASEKAEEKLTAFQLHMEVLSSQGIHKSIRHVWK